MTEKRTYKANLEKSRAGLSAEAIHRGKCAAKRNAREARKAASIARAFEQKGRAKASDYPAKQLVKLDFRLGVGVGAKRERTKLEKRL